MGQNLLMNLTDLPDSDRAIAKTSSQTQPDGNCCWWLLGGAVLMQNKVRELCM
jgi:hypothetical protein